MLTCLPLNSKNPLAGLIWKFRFMGNFKIQKYSFLVILSDPYFPRPGFPSMFALTYFRFFANLGNIIFLEVQVNHVNWKIARNWEFSRNALNPADRSVFKVPDIQIRNTPENRIYTLSAMWDSRIKNSSSRHQNWFPKLFENPLKIELTFYKQLRLILGWFLCLCNFDKRFRQIRFRETGNSKRDILDYRFMEYLGNPKSWKSGKWEIQFSCKFEEHLFFLVTI